tara:strand:- start:760 stop:942 length:183 start_codon:yes stop_codon:yes gene_type:complete
MATAQGKDSEGNTVTMEFDITQGLKIFTIGGEQEWVLTTIDDSPATYITPHIGGRPDDRN